jgi:LysM repeat protein
MHGKMLLKPGFRHPTIFVLVVVLFLGLGLSLGRNAQAAPPAQVPIYTPTPGPDGRIIYIVQPNDTLLRISLISGVPVDQLRALNNLTSDTIYEGQRLLLGLAGPAEVVVTPGPTPTATPVLPTPSPSPGSGNLCILLFEDRNGDSIRQTEETSIAGGAISINDRLGTTSETVETTANSEHYCFEKLPEGEYSVSVAIPVGFNPTTETSIVLPLKAGDETYIDFGAQVNSQTQEDATLLPEPEKRTPLLGIIGGLFLLGGLVLALVATRLLRTR